MAEAIVKRLAGLVAVLLLMTLVIFCLQQVVPADPARAAAGPNAPAAVVEAKRKEMGLDDPLLVRYWRYLGSLVQGDLGRSVRTRNPVATDLGNALPASIELMVFALAFGGLAGVWLGVVQTLSRWRGPLRLAMTAAGSMPIFLTGLLLTLLFWFELGWMPFGGRISVASPPEGPTGLLTIDGLLTGRPGVTLNALWHLAIPAICLALPVIVAIGRSTNASLLGVLRQNYIKTARSKGLSPRRIVLGHALRNALSAPLAMFGLQFGLMFGNLLIIERIFSWPGVGLYAVGAFASTDLPAILGISLVFGAAYIVLNMLIDFVQALVDPQIARAA